MSHDRHIGASHTLTIAACAAVWGRASRRRSGPGFIGAPSIWRSYGWPYGRSAPMTVALAHTSPSPECRRSAEGGDSYSDVCCGWDVGRFDA